jgi:lipopolysaccharide transport system ATP-binding protein
MAEPFIHFDAVWKKFRRGEHHDTVRDLLLSFGRRLGARDSTNGDPDEFWAVRDVSFEVRPGETLGIIGGNGAGKSTVLKLLTRILRPNKGALRVEGRIGALIEVSAGFHPDLTGRENIFLQGALMGMRKATIEQKFDQIVEFSGIAEFLDTPVKRYSSGMNARLGFSIAAHLDPDVLIIDEVLAVGDFRFQQRAFERLHELAQSGRPVVVVSHQLERIAQLCSKAILLVGGQVHAAGSVEECIATYLGRSEVITPADAPFVFGAPVITPSLTVPTGSTFAFTVRVTRRAPAPSVTIGVRARTLSDKQILFATSASRQNLALPAADEFSLECMLEAHLLPGQYIVESYAFDPVRGELCTSAPAYLQVSGDHGFAIGRTHLGGRMAVGVGAVTPPRAGRILA